MDAVSERVLPTDGFRQPLIPIAQVHSRTEVDEGYVVIERLGEILCCRTFWEYPQVDLSKR